MIFVTETTNFMETIETALSSSEVVCGGSYRGMKLNFSELEHVTNEAKRIRVSSNDECGTVEKGW